MLLMFQNIRVKYFARIKAPSIQTMRFPLNLESLQSSRDHESIENIQMLFWQVSEHTQFAVAAEFPFAFPVENQSCCHSIGMQLCALVHSSGAENTLVLIQKAINSQLVSIKCTVALMCSVTMQSRRLVGTVGTMLEYNYARRPNQ